MDCARYEELLFAGLDADLEPVERERMARHEQGCARCRDLAAAVGGQAEPMPPDVADELAAEVFARTSGAAALERLQRELPALAEADPGPQFLSSVLAATIGREAPEAVPAPVRDTGRPSPARVRRAPSPRLDLSRLWQRLALRPRLALEGSFVVTMLALLIFGLPSTTESPVRAFDSWWRGRTDAARELIENASESAQRGIDSLWNENGSGGVEPDNPD